MWGGDPGRALLSLPTLRMFLQSPFPPLVPSCDVGCCDMSEAQGQRGEAGPGWVTGFWLPPCSSLLLLRAELPLEPTAEWDRKVKVPMLGAD